MTREHAINSLTCMVAVKTMKFQPKLCFHLKNARRRHHQGNVISSQHVCCSHFVVDFIQSLPFIIKNNPILDASSASTTCVSPCNEWRSKKNNPPEQIEKRQNIWKVMMNWRKKIIMKKRKWMMQRMTILMTHSLWSYQHLHKPKTIPYVKVMHDLNVFIGKNISRKYFLPLKEETNINFINPGQLSHAMLCARCERALVKSSKPEHYNKVFNTMFNSRKPVMCCENLLTEGHPMCGFLSVIIVKEDWLLMILTKRTMELLVILKEIRGVIDIML